MANPNLLSATSCYGDSDAGGFQGQAGLLLNGADSGKVFKIIALYICNNSTTAANFIRLYTQYGTSTANNIADKLELPPKTTVILATKDNPIYIPENTGLYGVTGVPISVNYAITWEEYSE